MAKNSDYVAITGKKPTPSGKVNFPYVFEQDDKGKFSLMIVFKKEQAESPEFKAMIEALNEAASTRFEGVTSYKDSFKGKALNNPFKTSEHYDFLEDDEVAIRLKSKFKPQIVDADGQTYLTDDDGFYSGCIARATYVATAYDQEGNRGVSFQLNNLQKTGMGKRFAGARKAAADEFDAVETDESLEEMPSGETDF
jgi:hypothetical protein